MSLPVLLQDFMLPSVMPAATVYQVIKALYSIYGSYKIIHSHDSFPIKPILATCGMYSTINRRV